MKIAELGDLIVIRPEHKENLAKDIWYGEELNDIYEVKQVLRNYVSIWPNARGYSIFLEAYEYDIVGIIE